MIKLKLLNGPFANKEYVIMSMITPGRFLHGVYSNGWLWNINYSEATIKEKDAWIKHDIALRCIRALRNNRVVKFMDKIYRAESGEDKNELRKICQKLEDSMVNSGRIIFIDSEDDEGVVVGHLKK